MKNILLLPVIIIAFIFMTLYAFLPDSSRKEIA
jgi:uncharacterized BrkB/YihY/UPF0761 family membrane protein